MIRLQSLLSATSVLLLASGAFAQSFNLDVGDDSQTGAGVPVNTYGAAANQPGHWNTSTFIQNWIVLGGVKDLSGAPTNITTSCVQVGNSVGNFYFNNAATTGEDEKLLDDCQDIGNGGVPSSVTWTFSGLANGCYDVYVYMWAPDLATYVTFIEDPNQPGSGVGQVVGGQYSGTLTLGAQYAVYTVNITTGSLTIQCTSNGVALNFGSVNGFQFVQGVTGCGVGTPFCSGDGTAGACPCANPGAAGNGCASSVNPNGANISAQGGTSVSADSLVLTGSGMPNSSCLYFQGTTQQAGGSGSAFGDGLRCAGGQVVRLGTKTNVAGTSQFPVAGDPSVSVKGLVPAGGGTRTYQAWYRNAATFCTVSTFNLSNGLQIVWTP